MPRRAKGLTAAAVQKAKVGRYFDGDGLVLTVRAPDSKYWSLRYHRDGKLREMGLGPACGRRLVTLAQARRLARDLYDQHKAGADPLAAKAGSRAAARANALLAPSFEKCALDYIEAHRSSWTNKIHAGQWETTLREYAFPKLGRLPVADITVAHVADALMPLWTEKPVTASRVRGRIEAVFGRAKALGLRDGENPARWKENLDTLLPKRSKTQRVQLHHAAMPYQQLGEFMLKLRAVDSNIARALEFCVLTAARTEEVLSARFDEIDLAARLWIIPGSRMKMGKEHRVPLSARAVEILQQMQRHHDGRDFIFLDKGRPLGSMAMLRLLQQDLGRPDVTVHGFRSSFSDWCSESTAFSSEVREMALAHKVSDVVEAAYRRGDLLAKRFALMEQWSKYCAAPSHKADGKTVVSIRGGA